MADNPIFPIIWHCFPNIPKITRQTKKISSFFFFISSFFLSLLLSFSWVNAKEAPKPKLQDWQFEGIVAALDDQSPEVRQKAVEKLTEYDLQNLQSQQRQEFAKKAVDILKDEKVPDSVRSLTAEALGKLGDAAQPYVPDIIAILKDEKVSYFVRSLTADALGSLGNAVRPYVPDILAFLKDETVNISVRSLTADALDISKIEAFCDKRV